MEELSLPFARHLNRQENNMETKKKNVTFSTLLDENTETEFDCEETEDQGPKMSLQEALKVPSKHGGGKELVVHFHTRHLIEAAAPATQAAAAADDAGAGMTVLKSAQQQLRPIPSMTKYE